MRCASRLKTGIQFSLDSKKFWVYEVYDDNFGQKNKKFWMAAHAQPQEMSPDKTLYVAVVAAVKKRETKSGTGESAESLPEANCGQHTPECSFSRISRKIRCFGCACSGT